MQSRVLLLTTHHWIGGMQRVVANLARDFSARGWHVDSLYPGVDDVQPLLEWTRKQGAPAEAGPSELHIWSPRSPKALLAIRRAVRRCRPDIVNAHYGENFISGKDVLMFRLAGVRRVVTSMHTANPWDAYTPKQRASTRLAGRLAHATTVYTEASKAILVEAGIAASKITVIPCGVQPPAEIPERAAARSRLGVPGDAFVIATSARLVEDKGVADLIDAVAELGKPLPHIVVCGDGPERQSLETRASEKLPGRALFLGHRDDVSDVYAAADLFALATRMENCALVLREAAFFGLPVVTTCVGGNPETVQEGRTGILVPPREPMSLAEAIRRLRDDAALRASMSSAARIHAEREFTAATMADRYERLFLAPNAQRPTPGSAK